MEKQARIQHRKWLVTAAYYSIARQIDSQADQGAISAHDANRMRGSAQSKWRRLQLRLSERQEAMCP